MIGFHDLLRQKPSSLIGMELRISYLADDVICVSVFDGEYACVV